MCLRERFELNIQAVQDVNNRNILGDIIEIGIYKGLYSIYDTCK